MEIFHMPRWTPRSAQNKEKTSARTKKKNLKKKLATTTKYVLKRDWNGSQEEKCQVHQNKRVVKTGLQV